MIDGNENEHTSRRYTVVFCFGIIIRKRLPTAFVYLYT